jgi:hypothetical protein
MTMLRKAPSAEASVGVMIPPNMAPNTKTMRPSQGSRFLTAVNFSRQGTGGDFGAILGLRTTCIITVAMRNVASMMPGTIAAAKRRETEMFSQTP